MDVSKIGGSNELVQKWEGALDGISDNYQARVTAQLLENQAQAVLAETRRYDEEALSNGSTQVGNIGTYQKFAFPLVRRVYPNLIFNMIGSTQPMDGPVSQIFYLGNSRWSAANQQTVYSKFNLSYRGLTTSAIGSVTAAGETWSDPAAGQLNDGMDYHFLTGTAFDTSNVVDDGHGDPETTMGGKIASYPDPTTHHAWFVSAGEALDGTDIPEIQFHIEQQPVVAKTRKMRALWTLEASQDLKAYHNLDLERELTDLLSKELSLEIDRELIEDIRMIAYGYDSNENTNLPGSWSPLSLDPHTNSNDLGTQYGQAPNGHTEAALGSLTWDNGGLPTNAPAKSNVFVVDINSGFAGTEYAPQHLGHRFSNVLAMINYASQDIYKTTFRGPGTVLVTSPLMASLLESAAKLEGGIPEKDGPTNMGGSIEYRGKFAGKYTLIVDPMFPEDEILVAYNGGNPMDSGFVYCPYIPLMPLPTVTDPGSFQPRKGIMTRYAKAAIQPASRFYRVVRVVGASLTPDMFRNSTVLGASV